MFKRNSDGIELGDRVKDKISGVRGICIGYHYWLYGCERVTIQPEEHKEGRPAEGVCVDAAQVEIVRKGVIKGYTPPVGVVDSRDVINRPAGPRQDPSRSNAAPRR